MLRSTQKMWALDTVADIEFATALRFTFSRLFQSAFISPAFYGIPPHVYIS